MYAIVDIETTGGYASAHAITEISIRVFDGSTIVDKFETLINPGQPIPRYIQVLTGITDDMVAYAPSFDLVAEKIYKILDGCIFVAHNVNFDYSFLKTHLASAGFEYNAKRLCTVRLSRKIFPGFQSYSLGNLCRSLDIEIENRHRAGGDSEATVEVFSRLMQHDSNNYIAKSLQRASGEQMLPPNVPKAHFDNLPYQPGVYYFHNEKGKIIYVGKAKNIRYRVSSHFTNNLDTRQKQNFIRHTHAISFRTCGTELMAYILESSEIKKLWPIYNYSQKRWEDVYGIFSYEDQNGYIRLAIEKNKKNLTSIYTFHYLVDGHATLRKLIQDFELCPRLCFMQKDNEECGSECNGACRHKEDPESYNARVAKAIESLRRQPTFAIIDKGIQGDDHSCVLVLDGRIYGMGYLPSYAQVASLEQLKEYLEPMKENSTIRNIVYGYAAKFPSKITLFNGQATENFPLVASH